MGEFGCGAYKCWNLDYFNLMLVIHQVKINMQCLVQVVISFCVQKHILNCPLGCIIDQILVSHENYLSAVTMVHV